MFVVDKRYITSVFCFLFFCLYFIGQAIESKVILSCALVFAFFAAVLSFKFSWKVFFVYLLVAFTFVIVILFNNGFPTTRLYFNIAFLFVNIMLVFSIVNGRVNIPVVLSLSILMLILFVIVCAIISFSKSLPLYVYMETVLKGFSYNYVSGFLILSSSLYYAYYENLKLKAPLGKTLSVILVVLCFLLYGRSGILFSLLLFIFNFRFFFNPKHGVRFFFILCLTVLAVILLGYYSFAIYDVVQHSKFREGIESPRFVMLHEYFDALDVYGLIFGVDITKLPTIASFNYNPHNSLINLHAMLGMVSIIFIMIVLLSLINKMSTNPWLVLFLLIYLARGCIDTMIFPGNFDYIFMAILFFSHRLKFQRIS